jgi:hypothetical protein
MNSKYNFILYIKGKHFQVLLTAIYRQIWQYTFFHNVYDSSTYIEQWRVFSTVGSFRPPPYILSL